MYLLCTICLRNLEVYLSDYIKIYIYIYIKYINKYMLYAWLCSRSENYAPVKQGRSCPVWHSVLFSTHFLDICVLGIVIGIGS